MTWMFTDCKQRRLSDLEDAKMIQFLCLCLLVSLVKFQRPPALVTPSNKTGKVFLTFKTMFIYCVYVWVLTHNTMNM